MVWNGLHIYSFSNAVSTKTILCLDEYIGNSKDRKFILSMFGVKFEMDKVDITFYENYNKVIDISQHIGNLKTRLAQFQEKSIETLVLQHEFQHDQV